MPRMVAISLSPRCPGIAGNFMESAAMVPSAIGGSAHLYFPVVAFARFSQHIFLHLFVCSRSLAIPGLPGNHHALRQWDCTAGRTFQTLARLARAWSHSLGSAEHCSCLPRTKAGCIATLKRFIGRLSRVIPAAGWRRLTSATSCTRLTAFQRRWTCLSKLRKSNPP